MGETIPSHYRVHVLVTPSGERLPMLIDDRTSAPCKVALRWYLFSRRNRVAASTAVDDLRAVAQAYAWADDALDTGLDTHLANARGFTGQQIASLAQFVKTAPRQRRGGKGDVTRDPVSPLVFNNAWNKLRLFLCWAASWYTADQRPRQRRYHTMKYSADHIARLFQDHLQSLPLSLPVRPLSTEEWGAIETALAPERTDVWPDPAVWARNRAMVYLAINTGVRTGEMLKLKLHQLPKGADKHIVVLRHPDDPLDTRTHSPEAKTNEREIPIGRSVRQMLAEYVTEYRPRNVKSPYVFLAQGGRALSGRAARQIMERLSDVTGHHVRWHRLRHTALNKYYADNEERLDAVEMLMLIAGWSDRRSADPYLILARQRRAYARQIAYQDGLYPVPIPGEATTVEGEHE